MNNVEPPPKRRKLSDTDAVSETIVNQSTLAVSDPTKQDEEKEAVHDSENGATAPTKAASNEEDNSESLPTTQPISKSQSKKLRRKQEWEAGRDFRKAKRREKNHERKVRKRERYEQEREDRKSQGLDPAPRQSAFRRRPTRLPITFLIDCGFDDKMDEKERTSLGSQLTRAYSDNHKAPFQAYLYISSWGGFLKERFDTLLEKSYQNWKGVEFTTEDFVVAAQMADTAMKDAKGGRLRGIFEKHDAAAGVREDTKVQNGGSNNANNEAVRSETNPDNQHSSNQPDADQTSGVQEPSQDLAQPTVEDLKQQSEVIYLSSESPHTLTELKPYSTYIVGGLVDKNRHKGLCYQTACERGIKTAKLPIGEFMEMQSRFVLATNHVVEIMIRWLECGDWGESFMKVIPKRKGGKLRDSKNDGDVVVTTGDKAESVRREDAVHNHQEEDDDGSDSDDGLHDGDVEPMLEEDEVTANSP